jgi:hypothetical protein
MAEAKNWRAKLDSDVAGGTSGPRQESHSRHCRPHSCSCAWLGCVAILRFAELLGTG